MTRSDLRILPFWKAFLRRSLFLLPRRTRQQYADELGDVYDATTQEAYDQGGVGALAKLLPHLIVDLGAAIATEYVDLWRRSTYGPSLVARSCLLIAGLFWALILIESQLQVGWAGELLNLNLTLTIVATFALPTIALVASWAGSNSNGQFVRNTASLLCVSATSAATTWSILAWHVVGTSG